MRQFIECPECGKPIIAQVKESKGICLQYFFWCNCGSSGVIDNLPNSELKVLEALSIQQPFAWLITQGYKTLENRNNLKNFKGKFLIHAGMKFSDDWINKCGGNVSTWTVNNVVNRHKADMNTGGIVGAAEITGFTEDPNSMWFTGKYGLKIINPIQLNFVPCKGKLSFFIPKI